MVGTRALDREQPVQRSWGRRWVFRAFRLLVRGLVGMRFSDTQCGAKVIPASAYSKVADQLKERGFVFEVFPLL